MGVGAPGAPARRRRVQASSRARRRTRATRRSSARRRRTISQDYSLRVVDTARADREAARRIVASGEGSERVDALRALFDEFVADERQEADERRERADRFGRIAIGLGGAGLFGTALLVLLFAGYLSRAVVAPVERVARRDRPVAAGELSARVSDTGRGDEVGRLGRSFNAMAGSLEEARDELESQNAELEAQQGELERAVSELAEGA